MRRPGIVLATVVGLLAAFNLPANAVHDDGFFELDGNTLNGVSTPLPGGGNSSTVGDDWSNLYTDHTTGTASGFQDFTFINDKTGTGGDNTFWTGGGSKDRNDIAQWQFGTGDQSPDKNDIVNAMAAMYKDTSVTPSQRQLYFGADRFAVNGDAQMGFWFLRNRVCLAGTTTGGVTCPNTNPGKFVDPDTGLPAHHADGDILVLVNFNNGGTIGLAGVYVWAGGVGGEPVPTLFGTGADCLTIGPNDDFCSVANKVNLPNEPIWPYTRKGGGSSYLASAFVEGGIDLGSIPGAGQCFPTFMAETRSSSGPSTGLSLDAQLKDLAFGQFELCGSTTETTPKQVVSGANQNIPAAGTSITAAGSIQVRDTATVTVTGAETYGGTVSFFLCGPTPLADASYTLCTTGGVPQGVVNVSQPSPSNVESTVATVTSVGRYCWRAVYSGDSTVGVPGSSDSRVTECFKVNPVTPTLSTQAVDALGANISAAVPFGQKIYDTATLAGAANQPGTNGALMPPATVAGRTINADNGAAAGGSITFKLYGPTATATAPADPAAFDAACATLATGFPAAGITVDVSGNGTYGGPTSTPAVEFQPASPGFYHWKATYSGNAPNTTAAPLDANGDPIQHNAACGLAPERVEVQQLPTSITTRQFVYPQDKARIAVNATGDLATLEGNVTFKLFGPTGGGTPQTAAQNCATNSDTVGVGGLLYTEGPLTINGASPQEKTTNNQTVRLTADTTVVWRVTYVSTKTSHVGSVSECVESTSVTYAGNDTANISIP